MGRSGKQSSKGLERAQVVGAAVALVTLAAALYATQQHPADDITLNAMGVSTITVKGSTTGTFFAYAKSMLLTASSGQLDVALPVPATDCSLIQRVCQAGRAQVDQPVSSAWPAPRSLEVDNASGSQIHLGTILPEQGGGVSFSVTGPGPLQLCIGPAGDGSALALRIGTTDVTFPATPVVPCGSGLGLVLSFRPALQSPTSGLILQGVTAVRTRLQGNQLTLSYGTLRLTLHSTASDTTYDGGGGMEIDSDQAFYFTAGGVPPALTAQDQVVSGATHVRESGVERLANAYNHYTWTSYGLTALGALVTLLFWRLGR
jgi:hypothetical protein